jgi:2-dehydro-3-deoxyphosphooctonate aldolase (KDO 8-P synthase)
VSQKTVSAAGVSFNNTSPFSLIAGPCVIESEKFVLSMARELKAMAAAKRIPFIFKSSYDKANRSSVKSFRGPGLKEGLRILARVRQELKVPY